MFHRLFNQLLSNWVCMTLGAGRCPRGMFLNLGTEVWETSQAVGKCRVTPDSYTGLRGEVLWSMQLMKQFLVQAPRSDFQSGIKTSNPLNENIHSASVSSGCSTEQKWLASQKRTLHAQMKVWCSVWILLAAPERCSVKLQSALLPTGWDIYYGTTEWNRVQ